MLQFETSVTFLLLIMLGLAVTIIIAASCFTPWQAALSDELEAGKYEPEKPNIEEPTRTDNRYSTPSSEPNSPYSTIMSYAPTSAHPPPYHTISSPKLPEHILVLHHHQNINDSSADAPPTYEELMAFARSADVSYKPMTERN